MLRGARHYAKDRRKLLSEEEHGGSLPRGRAVWPTRAGQVQRFEVVLEPTTKRKRSTTDQPVCARPDRRTRGMSAWSRRLRLRDCAWGGDGGRGRGRG